MGVLNKRLKSKENENDTHSNQCVIQWNNVRVWAKQMKLIDLFELCKSASSHTSVWVNFSVKMPILCYCNRYFEALKIGLCDAWKILEMMTTFWLSKISADTRIWVNLLKTYSAPKIANCFGFGFIQCGLKRRLKNIFVADGANQITRARVIQTCCRISFVPNEVPLRQKNSLIEY